jgi:hypothetical protein
VNFGKKQLRDGRIILVPRSKLIWIEWAYAPEFEKECCPMNPLTYRHRICIRTFVAAAFAVLLGFVFQLERQNRAYRQRISLNYARAFSQLAESMGNLDTALEKSIYVTTPEMIAGLCAEIYSDAASARQAASTLPYANVELEQLVCRSCAVGRCDHRFSHSRY